MILGKNRLTTRVVCDRCRRAPATIRESQLVSRHCLACDDFHDLCRWCLLDLRLLEPAYQERWVCCPDALEVARVLMGEGG